MEISCDFCFLSSIADQDLDDLDLLASLVDSDSEFLDDSNFIEETSSNSSAQSTTQTQQPPEHGVQSAGTKSSLTMEEMAG